MKHVANEMTLAVGQIQGKLDGKGDDITNFKQKFQPKEKNMKLSDYDTWQSKSKVS